MGGISTSSVILRPPDVILSASHLLCVEICLGGRVRAGSRGHRGTAADPVQHGPHGRQPLHGGKKVKPDALQIKEIQKEESRVESNTAGGAQMWLHCPGFYG